MTFPKNTKPTEALPELADIRKSVRNAMGAIESNQVVDKDVHGTLKDVLKRIDAVAAALSLPPQEADPAVVLTGLNVDALAQEIRRVDGNHDKGAGALAEALMPFLAAIPSPSKDLQHTEGEAARLDCGIPDPSTRDCQNMKEVGGGMDGERYRCDVCGKGYYLDYEDMK